jgi:hypothetical protein
MNKKLSKEIRDEIKRLGPCPTHSFDPNQLIYKPPKITINKDRIQKRVKELGYKSSDDKGEYWEKRNHRGEDLSVSIGKDEVEINLVCHPYKEGWDFRKAKTTLGAIRIINKFELM